MVSAKNIEQSGQSLANGMEHFHSTTQLQFGCKLSFGLVNPKEPKCCHGNNLQRNNTRIFKKGRSNRG